MPLPGIAHIVSDRRVSGTFARECEPLPEERPGDQLKMLRISGGHPSHTVATAGARHSAWDEFRLRSPEAFHRQLDDVVVVRESRVHPTT